VSGLRHWKVLKFKLTTHSSSGLLIYASLVDLLAEDFLSEEASRTLTKKDRIMAFGFVILGGKAPSSPSSDFAPETDTSPAIGMSIVGAFA
jgi:hypothetical protein